MCCAVVMLYPVVSQDLLYVVPFVAKILESCSESRVCIYSLCVICMYMCLFMTYYIKCWILEKQMFIKICFLYVLSAL